MVISSFFPQKLSSNGSRKLRKFLKVLLMLMIICVGNRTLASDNVLQAIQIDGVKDSYNIILKSDDTAELKKTIQAPNKIILDLKGIRASKTINTIYNNTSNVDSVVVEPAGDDAVKILIQADNASNASIHFDSLKTPLGVLDNSVQSNKASDEILLSQPMESYKPVYNQSQNNEEEVSLSSSAAKYLKKALKSQKAGWVLAMGFLSIFLMSGMKLIKGNDNDIRVGLTQSLKDREVELYKDKAGVSLNSAGMHKGMPSDPVGVYPNVGQPIVPGGNYGLKAYQQNNRSPYITSEMQRPRPAVAAPSVNLQQLAKTMSLKQSAVAAMPNTMQNTIQRTAPTSTKTKSTNIDSMKFLESMTKIYEKNGRTDLAQGLKTNMKKAKMNLM